MRTAYIALGANLASSVGPPEATLAAAVLRLKELGSVTRQSSLYSTEPVGVSDQPRFINAVVALETNLGPQALINKLLAIEKDFGRDRSNGIPNGPRTLDLDILMLGDLKVAEPGLDLPHPRLAQRAFVLVPLFEIAPQSKVAGHGKTVADLLQAFQSNNKGDADAVVRIESDVWRAAADD